MKRKSRTTYPTYFPQDGGGPRRSLGSQALLSGNRLSDGFVRLWEEQRLDLSVEALALQEPWSSLFTHEELAEAQTAS